MILLAGVFLIASANAMTPTIAVKPIHAKATTVVKKPTLLTVQRKVLRSNLDQFEDDDDPDDILVDSALRPRDVHRTVPALPARIRERLALMRYLAVLRVLRPTLHEEC